tara:strand:- start:823 stop:1119 length:297 start_codon:yes stop_codon:yes gene_type:complete
MAIRSKGLQYLGFVPDKDFVLQDNGNGAEIRDWNSSAPVPSEAEIEAAYTAWGDDYARKRQAAYASLGDQLDMQYHDLVDNTTTWKDHISSVKTSFPK